MRLRINSSIPLRQRLLWRSIARVTRVGYAMSLTALMAPCCLVAQPHESVPPAADLSTSADTVDTTHAVLPPHLATITTDTGALAPGHRDFSRYRAPQLCLAAVQTTRAALQRTLVAQATAAALQRTPQRDTVPAAVITVARVCVAHFQVARTSLSDLPSLFVLALFAQQDSVAHAVLARQLALAQSDSIRAQALEAAVVNYLAAAPARVADAEALVAQVDAQGRSTADASLWVLLHRHLLGFWQQSLDVEHSQQEAEQLLTFLHGGRARGLPASVLEETIHDAYRALLVLAYAAYPEQPDSLLPVVQRAKQDLSRIPRDTIWVDPSHGNQRVPVSAGQTPRVLLAAGYQMQIIGADWRTKPLADVMDWLKPEGLTLPGDLSRLPLRVHADYWFPAGTDTVQPTPGRVTVIYELPQLCVAEWEMMLWWPDACAAPMLQLQQWQQRYGAAGLQIVVVAALSGHLLFGDSEAPAEVARDLGWYVRGYWHLPVTVAVRAAPPIEATGVVVTDRRGVPIFRYRSDNVFDGFLRKDAQLRPLLEILLARSVAADTGKAIPGAPSVPTSSPSLAPSSAPSLSRR